MGQEDVRGREIVLAENGRPLVTVVHGAGVSTMAELLVERLQALSGVRIPQALDTEVVEAGTWRWRREWTARSVVLIGSIYDNQAMLGLACRRLVGANSQYPGRGKFELRTLFGPSLRGADVLVIAAVDEVGLQAGVDRVCALVQDSLRPAELRIGTRVEIGSPAGVESPTGPTGGEFARMVYEYIWHGNVRGAAAAQKHLRGEMAKRSADEGLWGFRTHGHYEWERHYLSLIQFVASGYLPDDDVVAITHHLLPLALRNTDYTSVSALNPTSDPHRYTRHCMSGLASQFLLHEYLDRAAPWPKDLADSAARGEVTRNLGVLRAQLQTLIECDRYRMESSEGFSTMETLGNLGAMTLHLGEVRAVRNGVFERQRDYAVAMRDNLGSDPGTNAYIACRPGSPIIRTVGGAGIMASAFFQGDPESVWLARHHDLSFTYLGVRMPPGMLAPPDDATEAFPERNIGLSVIPHDPWFLEHYLTPNEKPPLREGEAVLAYTDAVERSFSKAVLRDGFEADDAYVLLQGENIGPSFLGAGAQGNALVRFTEFGSVLLYQNVQKVTSWARSVVSVSRGRHDPVTAACCLDTGFETPRHTGFSSRLARTGGGSWTRHVVHRRRAYFAVLDEVTVGIDSREAEPSQVVCRWRSFHPGRLVDKRRFTAVDGQRGVRLHIVGSRALVADVTLEDRDGSSRPTILRQYQSGVHAPGTRIRFLNILYADKPEGHTRSFDLRSHGDTAVLIRGENAGVPISELVGVGPVRVDGLVTSEAGLTVLGADEWVFAGCRRVDASGRFMISTDRPVQVFLEGETGRLELDAGTLVGVEGSVEIDGEPVPDRVALAAGTHSLRIPGFESILAATPTALASCWEHAGQSGAGDTLPAAVEPGNPTALRNGTALTRLRPTGQVYHQVKVRAEPTPLDGHPYAWARDPALWFDRETPWMGATVPGWESGEGTIILDLLEPVKVQGIRFVWPGHYQFHRFPTKPLGTDEIDVRVFACDDDEGSGALGVSTGTPESGWHYCENAHYMHTARFQQLTVLFETTARFLRVKIGPKPDGRRDRVLFSEIEVISGVPEERSGLRIRAAAGGQPRDVSIAAWNRNTLMLLTAEGVLLNEVSLAAPVVDLRFADIDGDGRWEVLVYTLDDMFTAFHADGTVRFRRDLSRHAGRSRWLSQSRPACFAAWRPDEPGHLETIFFPHYNMMRLSPEPELEHTWPEQGHTWGGKAAFTVPDISGDGRDELVVVGVYSGRAVRVLASDSDLENGKCRVLHQHRFTGYSSGNMELPLYFDGHMAEGADGRRWVVTLTPGGLDCFDWDGFEKLWCHFNHPPNHCSCVWRTADGRPALVVGRGDGFLTRYDLADGGVDAVVGIGRDVRAVASGGSWLAAGGPDGLFLLDDHLRILSRLDRPVDDMTALRGQLIVGFSDGDVVSFSPRP